MIELLNFILSILLKILKFIVSRNNLQIYFNEFVDDKLNKPFCKNVFFYVKLRKQ
jgi:hypothetical protein